MKNEPSEMILHAYKIPTEKSLFLSPVIKSSNLGDLDSMNKRLRNHEMAFWEKQQKLIELQRVDALKHMQALKKSFSSALAVEVEKLNLEADKYFEELALYCSEFCKSVLERLFITIPDEEKLRAIVYEMLGEYKGEADVQLHVPKEGIEAIGALNLPDGWEVVASDNLEKSTCCLKLGFGEVVGNFDETFNVLSSLVAQSE